MGVTWISELHFRETSKAEVWAMNWRQEIYQKADEIQEGDNGALDLGRGHGDGDKWTALRILRKNIWQAFMID